MWNYIVIPQEFAWYILISIHLIFISVLFKKNFYYNIYLFLLFIVTNFEWKVNWNYGIMLEILPRNPKLQMDVLFSRGQKLCCLPTLQRNYGNEWLYYQPSWMYISWPVWKILVIFYVHTYVTSNFFYANILTFNIWGLILPCKFEYYTKG